MVSIICKDGAFLAKGTFDFGIVGTYENKEYGEGNIEIRYDLENLLGDLDADYQWMKPLREALCDIPKDADSVAKALENYYNAKEVKVQKNIKQLKDYFLYRLVEDLFECGFPYWEIKGGCSARRSCFT